ncbi:MAG TPA: TerB family tellurite resistance protein [Polyangiaceae bacterium LLY-WYZ-14_1]|nr:TerB family tellurite resistance protein [Polyangiaceae bacterium LLY-WYZ-14_1]
MFFRRNPEATPAPTVGEELLAVVRQHMADADEAEVRVVAAVAGLFACVAYADRDYSPAEAEQIRRYLGHIQDLPPEAARAIGALLDRATADLARVGVHGHTRVVKEGTEREARVELLEVLMDIAAADGTIRLSETELLRQVAKLLGLGADDYLAVQDRHRDKLEVLAGR